MNSVRIWILIINVTNYIIKVNLCVALHVLPMFDLCDRFTW